MHDIKSLEAQWEKYDKKRKKPLYRILWIIALLGLLAVVSFLNKERIKNNLKAYAENNESNVTTKVYAFPIAMDGPLETLAVKKVVAQTAKVPIVAKEVKTALQVKENKNPMDPEDVFVDTPASVKKQSVKKKVKNKIHIEVIDVTSMSAYKVIEERFKAAPDSDDALFLARGYFSKGKYQKAAYWALQTNKLDRDVEESWLLFARAKTKMGQKNEAIRILSAYAKRSNSLEAYKLLKQLKQ